MHLFSQILFTAHCLEFDVPASEVSLKIFTFKASNQINFRGGSTNRLSGGFIFFAESYTLHPAYDPVG
jgi:hypothetical protein